MQRTINLTFIYCVTLTFYKLPTASADGMSREQGAELKVVGEEHAQSNLECYLAIGLQ